MARFDGKAALVTGAGSGIGAAVAEALTTEGAAVAAFDLDGEAARETVRAIEDAGGAGRAIAIAGDARSEQDAAGAVAAAVEAFGGLDLLAPLAGVLRVAPTAEMSLEEWSLVLDTNVTGPFLFVRAAIPELRRRGGGAIVLAGSAMAYASTAGAAVYSASKGALVAMTNALALELAPDGVRVNAIAPGTIRTQMLRTALADPAAPDPAATEAALDAIGAPQPLGRLIEPEEVARLVLFLLSDDASAIAGACYRVDGALLSGLPA